MAIVYRGRAAAGLGTEFIREGLRLGHWCCFVAPIELQTGMLSRLRELGHDVDRHLDNRTLQIPPQAPTAGDMLEGARTFFAQAEIAHAPAIRWLEEGMGAKPEGTSATRFFELHARLNFLVKHYPSVALCQYNADHLEIPDLFSAIAVHRHLLVEGTLVRDNPFYIPAEKFVAMSPEDREHNIRDVFREVGFDLGKLLSTLAGYGQLQRPAPPGV